LLARAPPEPQQLAKKYYFAYQCVISIKIPLKSVGQFEQGNHFGSQG
jgi:hypothetical protein